MLKFIRNIFFTFIIFLTFFGSVNRTYATESFSSNVIGDKKIIKPEKLVLVKINPLIKDPQQFLKALDMLFVNILKNNQNVFAYVAIDDLVYRLRDLNANYASTQSNVVYIAYTSSVPLQEISNLSYVFGINKVLNGSIEFNNDKFNIIEKGKFDTPLLAPKYNIASEFIEASYEKNPEPGSIDDVKVKFKNTGDYPIISNDISPIIVTTSGGKDRASDMYINNVWYSKSRTGNLLESNVGIGETGTLQFSILAQPNSGEQTEKLILARSDGTVFQNTEFDIKINIPDKGQKVVEIKSTGAGFIQVKDKKGSGNAIGFANTGSKYLVLSDEGSYIKIRYQANNEGWVPTGSVKKLY